MPITGDSFSLILVRHGEAVPTGGAVRTDGERTLTARGADDAVALGGILKQLACLPELILTSPLVRATETGSLIASGLGAATAPAISRALKPGSRAEDFLEELVTLRRAGTQSVLAVGHQPDLGYFIAYLTAGSAPVSVALSPGTAAKLVLRTSGGRPEAVMQWLLPPSAVRLLSPSPEQRPSGA